MTYRLDIPISKIIVRAVLPLEGAETSALRRLRLLKNRRYAQACGRLVKALYESRKEAAIFAVASALTVYITGLKIVHEEDWAKAIME